ncbi:MAG: hypothetical protein COB36_14935, partial [Alphaproteobacteria bacterium]
MDFVLRQGDLLYRGDILVQHAGAYLGNNLVLHCAPEAGLEVIRYDEYSKGRTVRVIRTEVDDASLLAMRLQSIIEGDQRYHVLLNNCEHIANLLICGRKCSPQVQAAIIGALVGTFAGWHTNRQNWFWLTLIG